MHQSPLTNESPAGKRDQHENLPEGIEATSKEQLEEELADARLLHRLSIELIQEEGIAGLYGKIVDAAVQLMRSQYGSMQILHSDPDDGDNGKLRLLASTNFSPEAEKFWEWVYHDTGSSCGAALRAQSRAIIPDFTADEFMQSAPTLPAFLEAGIFAAQSTPLYSRGGKLLGMISTHWNYPYTPPERHLHLLDILARQAADLIERTLTNEALRQSEERLRALTTATSEMIYRMSADWSEMYQLDGRNFRARTDQPITDWLQLYVYPKDHEQVMRAFNEAIATKSTFQLEHRVLKPDGTVAWTFSRAIPILDSEGEIVEWFGAASDITEKKSFIAELEHRVEERTKELQRSNEDLQQFAHVASHDLKEPVRKIKTFGLRLLNNIRNNISDNTETYTVKILQSAQRMSTMIDGVLTYSSLNVAEQCVERLDLNKIIADIGEDLEVLITEKCAVIRSEQLPHVEGVHILIYQLFYNLINNSLKFSKENERPFISIKADHIAVDGMNHVRILIEDNGIGFDPENRNRIFDSFTRLNSKNKYDGTGLGLSLVKKIVERHHGTIEANGEKDKGSVFIITLPLIQPVQHQDAK